MNNSELYNEDHRATYCPEDDKLRLYVGRVPRPEYDALRAEGWQTTAKQDCDFSAVWSIERENTALSYAGEIDDEDTPPAERAADRAERFAGYRDKRTMEATGHADKYEAGPAVHGYQSQARAERAAARHDKIADRAVNRWEKAEYWTERTAGVIANALYRSSPAVRMGRIKTLEAELRKLEKSWSESTERAQAQFDSVLSVVEHAEGTREKLALTGAEAMANFRWSLGKMVGEEKPTPEQSRRAVVVVVLSGWRNSNADQEAAEQAETGTRPAAEIARDWLAGRTRPADWNPEHGTRGTRHLKMRLAYEMQMLEAQGGRAALVEMVPGGFLGSMQIVKVNKSNATGRVVSVGVMVKTHGKNRWGNPSPNEPEYRMEIVNIERMKAETYRAPTAEELEAFAAKVKAEKAARPKSTAPALINPTPEDAERLQALFNAANVSRWKRQHGRPLAGAPNYYTPPKAGTVQEMTQAQYSAASKGAYARHETREICQGGAIASKSWNAKNPAPVVCKVRVTGYEPYIVVRITDKPAKALPAAVWEAPTPTPENVTAPTPENVTA